jgi:hypothetical protein
MQASSPAATAKMIAISQTPCGIHHLRFGSSLMPSFYCESAANGQIAKQLNHRADDPQCYK